MNPFDFVNALNAGKNIMEGTENDALAEKSYVPFITNRQFSYFPDTVHAANEMNCYAHLDNKLQFSFFLNTIRPRKRFTKWSKVEHHADLQAVADYFGYSYEKAKVAMDVLTDDDIKNIKNKLAKGGLKK